MNDITPHIICENLVKIFKVADVEVLALQGLDLTVQYGELLGVVGASGSGKSTLMNVLGGLARPSAGQVIVDGHTLLTIPQSEVDFYRQDHVGFVWQQALRTLVPYLTAYENIMLPMTLAGKAGKSAQERARHLLELVELSDRMHHPPAQLSGGEQQRVAIAVGLANEPKLLLADEPTGELDSATSELVYGIFQRLNQELNLTIIIVSHDPLLAQHVGRVVAIRDGKTAAESVRRRHVFVNEQGLIDTREDDDFEEFIVLDSAGRLQIPKEYREQLAIKGHVHMEMHDGRLIVYPADYEKPHENGDLDLDLPVIPQKHDPDQDGDDHWLRHLWSSNKK